MTINYTTDEQDHLTYQLFVASQSQRIKRRRQRSRFVFALIYGVLGMLFIFLDRYPVAILFIGIALLWFFLYPIWERHYYRRHYQAFIKDHLMGSIGREVSLEITNDFILSKEQGNESKISTTDLVEINDIPSAIYIKLHNGQSLILPKAKIADIDKVATRLQELAEHLTISYEKKEIWIWK